MRIATLAALPMAAFWGHWADRLQRRPVLPGRRQGRSPQPRQRPVRGRTRRHLRPILPRSLPRPSRPPSTKRPTSSTGAPDERAARPRTVRRTPAASPTMSSPRDRTSATRSSRASGTCRAGVPKRLRPPGDTVNTQLQVLASEFSVGQRSPCPSGILPLTGVL